MSSSGDDWVLRYWPKLAGRAEFVRIIFEEAGVKRVKERKRTDFVQRPAE